MGIITWQTVFVLALAGIIIYFLLRIRMMLKHMPGADNKMNTIELIKNWQEEKAKEAQYQNEMKAYAREQARPEAERIMVDRYKQQAIKEMTTDKGSQMKEKMKTGLGIDLDKAASRENLAYMTGRTPQGDAGSNAFNKDNIKSMTGNRGGDVFNRDKIKEMSKTDISSDKLKNAASSNINWEGGMKKALKNENQMSGVERVLYGNKR